MIIITKREEKKNYYSLLTINYKLESYALKKYPPTSHVQIHTQTFLQGANQNHRRNSKNYYDLTNTHTHNFYSTIRIMHIKYSCYMT